MTGPVLRAFKELRNPKKRNRIGFATPMRRDAAAVVAGAAITVGAVAVAAPAAVAAGAIIFWTGISDAFEQGLLVSGKRRW